MSSLSVKVIGSLLATVMVCEGHRIIACEGHWLNVYGGHLFITRDGLCFIAFCSLHVNIFGYLIAEIIVALAVKITV